MFGKLKLIELSDSYKFGRLIGNVLILGAYFTKGLFHMKQMKIVMKYNTIL